MKLLKSLKSFFKRCGKKIAHFLTKYCQKEIIIFMAVAVGLGLMIAIVFVLKKNMPDKDHSGDDMLNISVSADGSDDASFDESSETDTASAETKVESTEDTTILVEKENAQKGYLNRCVFLGDSRTVAMVNYGLINDDAALAQIGISHPSFRNNTFVNNAGKQYTLKSYLSSHQSPVIYVALGVNGINDPSEDHYKTTYKDLIDDIMSKAPNSNIVLMSIGPVDDNGAYKNTVQNSVIRKYNDFLLETAREKHIFYLDISEVLTGDDGQVKPEYNGGDGLHYSGSGCQAIFDYIVDHPVPGISDEGEYVVKYVKPNPNNTKVTMDDGSGIDEEKLKEIMNMMVENQAQTAAPTATPIVTATPVITEPTPDPDEERRKEEEQREREEREREKEKEKEREEKEKEEERPREDEAKRKQAEEEEARKKAEKEAEDEEEARKKAEEEAAQKQAEEEARRKEEEEANKKNEEENNQTEEQPENPPEEKEPAPEQSEEPASNESTE